MAELHVIGALRLSPPLILLTSVWRKERLGRTRSLCNRILVSLTGLVCCLLAERDSPP